MLEFAKTAPTISARKRIRGLTLTTTDLDWFTGDGPEVTGPGESLLMALAGRRGITDELSGPGRPELARRIGDWNPATGTRRPLPWPAPLLTIAA